MTSWFDIFRMGVVSCLGVTYRGKGKVLECITAPVMPSVCFKGDHHFTQDFHKVIPTIQDNPFQNHRP